LNENDSLSINETDSMPVPLTKLAYNVEKNLNKRFDGICALASALQSHCSAEILEKNSNSLRFSRELSSITDETSPGNEVKPTWSLHRSFPVGTEAHVPDLPVSDRRQLPVQLPLLKIQNPMNYKKTKKKKEKKQTQHGGTDVHPNPVVASTREWFAT
jgi:hypothetical protein